MSEITHHSRHESMQRVRLICEALALGVASGTFGVCYGAGFQGTFLDFYMWLIGGVTAIEIVSLIVRLFVELHRIAGATDIHD